MLADMASCDKCCVIFIRPDNLKRHQRYSCNSTNSRASYHRRQGTFKHKISKHDDAVDDDEDDYGNNTALNGESITKKEIPEFDGAEFCGEKPKSRETLNRMMAMLKIPEHRWESIAKDFK